jgi:hypothetical protein
MATLFSLYPFLLKLYADGRYQGAGFQNALRTILKRVNVEIVKRSDEIVVVPPATPGAIFVPSGPE